MLDKVSTSSTARVSVARSSSASPGNGRARAHEVAPAVAAHDIQDDRPRWQEAGSDKEPPEQDQQDQGSGAAARQAIDDALKALLPEAGPRECEYRDVAAGDTGNVTGKGRAVTAPPQAAVSPHGRAVGAYGSQSELHGRGAVLRPGAVFSEQF